MTFNGLKHDSTKEEKVSLSSTYKIVGFYSVSANILCHTLLSFLYRPK